MIQPTPAQIEAAFNEARRIVDSSGYGSFVSDDRCREFATAIAVATLNATDDNPIKDLR